MKARNCVLLLVEMVGCGGTEYLKSRDIAEGSEYNARQVGHALSKISDDDGIPVDCNYWSGSGGANNYKIEVASKRSVDEYLYGETATPQPAD